MSKDAQKDNKNPTAVQKKGSTDKAQAPSQGHTSGGHQPATAGSKITGSGPSDPHVTSVEVPEPGKPETGKPKPKSVMIQLWKSVRRGNRFSKSKRKRDRSGDTYQTVDEENNEANNAEKKGNTAASGSSGTPTSTPLTDEEIKRLGKTLTENIWYHGLMPRQDCEDMLATDGDFLVRKTTIGGLATFCYSVLFKKEVRHIPISYSTNGWTLRGFTKPNLCELTDILVNNQAELPPSGAVLKKAIARPEYYILHEHITVKKKLGAGAFGVVYTGAMTKKITDSNGKEQIQEIPVAVKQLKGAMTKKQLAEFCKEAKVMRRFDFPNIVRIYGIAPQEEPLMIVLELATGGGLKEYCVKNAATLNGDQLTTFARDAARGMCYLSACKVIHRDLAARNCLLGPCNEVKISDFGMSIADQNEIKLDKLKSMPIKWLAPETLSKGIFSTKTDVWSFGVMLWELFSKCKTDPFPGENNQEARLKILSGKDPLDIPEGCPELGVKTIHACFTQDSEKRPDFEGILKMLAPDEEPPKAVRID